MAGLDSFSWRRGALALSLNVLLAGCAIKVGVQESSPALREGLPAGAVVAVAGVTASPAAGRLAATDAADAADRLLALLLEAFPQMTIMSPAATAGTAGEARLDSLVQEFGRLGAVAPARLHGLVAALPEVRFLAVASVDADRIATETVRQDLADPAARAEGLAEQGSPWGRTLATERHTTVSLALLDLADGTTAWRGRAEVADRIRYDYRAPEVDPRAAADAPPDPVVPTITRAGDSVRAPDLLAQLERALRELIAEIPGAAGASAR